MLNTGDEAPGFSLPGIDAAGNERVYSLCDYRGSDVILYFYPKDNTPGCTEEASDLTAAAGRLGEAVVIGVSPDSVDSHRRFIGKHGLNLLLLSDPDKSAAALYGALGGKKGSKGTMGITRSTFLIDGSGVILKAWYNVKVAGHVEEVLVSYQSYIDGLSEPS
jgi:peroxiredoxin Q/BCP